MMITEDKPTKTKTPITKIKTIPHDPWADWKPLWTRTFKKKKTLKTTHDFQEQHSPTQSVNIRISATRKKEQSQRRIVDARLWNAMSPIQQDAAIIIAKSFEQMNTGLGYATSNWNRIPSSGKTSNITEHMAHHINRYIEWTTHCTQQKISHAMILDILVFGHSCRHVDRDRRQRTGSAKQNLLDGLTLYCDLQGWK